MKIQILLKQPKSEKNPTSETSQMRRSETEAPSSHHQHYHQQVVELNQDYCIIGRSDSDLVLTDIRCSRQHALLYENFHGELHLKDLESTNGTFVNGDRVQEELILNPQDEIRIGKTLLLILDFKTAHVASQSEPPRAKGKSRRNVTEESQEPTQTKTNVIVTSGPDKFFDSLAPANKAKFVHYVDEEGTKASIPVSEILKRGKKR